MTIGFHGDKHGRTGRCTAECMRIGHDGHITFNMDGQVIQSLSPGSAETGRQIVQPAIQRAGLRHEIRGDNGVGRYVICFDQGTCPSLNGDLYAGRLFCAEIQHHLLTIALAGLHELVMSIADPKLPSPVGKVLCRTFPTQEQGQSNPYK